MKNKSYFIARDKNNSLWMYDCKPQRHDENWLFPNGCASYVELDAFNAAHGVDMFKYMTYDDDPLELIIKEHNTQVNGKSYFVAADDNGRITLFDRKPLKVPFKNRGYGEKAGGWSVPKEGQYQQINDYSGGHFFKNLTFNSDPIELVLVDKAKPSVNEPSVKDCFGSIFNIKL